MAKAPAKTPVGPADTETLSGQASGRLKSFVQRIENLEDEKAERAADIKEVYSEARGEGYDVKALRKVIRMKRQDAAKRAEEQAMIDLYLSALGLL